MDIPIMGSGTLGAYFLGAAPQIVGTLNANCSFPSDWTLFYLPGTSGWTGDTVHAGYKIALWDGETRWDNLRTSKFGYGWDYKGNEDRNVMERQHGHRKGHSDRRSERGLRRRSLL